MFGSTTNIYRSLRKYQNNSSLSAFLRLLSEAVGSPATVPPLEAVIGSSGRSAFLQWTGLYVRSPAQLPGKRVHLPAGQATANAFHGLLTARWRRVCARARPRPVRRLNLRPGVVVGSGAFEG